MTRQEIVKAIAILERDETFEHYAVRFLEPNGFVIAVTEDSGVEGEFETLDQIKRSFKAR